MIQSNSVEKVGQSVSKENVGQKVDTEKETIHIEAD